jgi:hypothetical protein
VTYRYYGCGPNSSQTQLVGTVDANSIGHACSARNPIIFNASTTINNLGQVASCDECPPVIIECTDSGGSGWSYSL